MTVDEYLRTGFEPDCEFLDGEVADRHAGLLPHASSMSNVAYALARLRPKIAIRVVTVIRLRISATRYRVADIAVWRNDDIGTGIPTVPPFLVVEILSPEDRMVRMLPKIQEYLSIGVAYVWVIDPQKQAALCYSQQQPQGAAVTVLSTGNPKIEIPLEAAFDLDA